MMMLVDAIVVTHNIHIAMSHRKNHTQRKPYKDTPIPKWLQLPQIETRDEVKEANKKWLYAQDESNIPFSAKMTLERISEKINSKRLDFGLLKFYEPLSRQDHHDITFALRKIGGTEDVLSGDFPEELAVFQDHIIRLLLIPPAHPDSIESLMDQSDFETLARYNLNWLCDTAKMDLLCTAPYVQSILNRIIAHINARRSDIPLIDISKNFLSRLDQKDLIHARNKLGCTDDILQDPEMLKVFQSYMDHIRTLDPENEESIESILSRDESMALKFLEYLPREVE
jgi:hypothetical protein